ncbi:MAG: DNA sulfur modification protein DndB [Acidimicrobiia bacterium]
MMEFSLPGIQYKQGKRPMVVTAMDPVALVKLVTQPDTWNPIGSQPHGNRPQDKAHREGIAQYLEEEEEFVLGSVVLYVSPREARFEPNPGAEDAPVALGTLHLNYGAEFDVGDGQHRIGAYSDVIKRHDEEGDPVLERLRGSGQPAVVVIDDNPLHRAQDFTDLQRNAKPPSGSIGMSMDRRQAINRFVVDLVQRSDVPLFEGGDRVEFLKDSPAKLSARLFSFKTIRYITGTAMIGVGQRTTAGWEKAANGAVEDDPDAAMVDAVELWKGLGTIDGLADVIAGTKTPAQVREASLLGAAGVQYAIAYAVYLARQDGVGYGDAARALAKVNFDRPTREPSESQPIKTSESVFAGNLIDPITGKVGSGRPAWEAAGQALYREIKTVTRGMP